MHAGLSNTKSCLDSKCISWPLEMLAVLTRHFMGDCLENTYFENIGNLKYYFMKKNSHNFLTVSCLDNLENFSFKNIASYEMKLI